MLNISRDTLENVIAAVVTMTTYDEYSAKSDYLETLSRACRELNSEADLRLFNNLFSSEEFCKRIGNIFKEA